MVQVMHVCMLYSPLYLYNRYQSEYPPILESTTYLWFCVMIKSPSNLLQIVVQWETVPGTAMADDYDPSRGVVTLAEGVGTEPIPLSITDETVPEFSEQFTVRLVGVVGGARLGGVTSTMVTISASDNPNGALRKFWNGMGAILEWECD